MASLVKPGQTRTSFLGQETLLVLSLGSGTLKTSQGLFDGVVLGISHLYYTHVHVHIYIVWSILSEHFFQ